MSSRLWRCEKKFPGPNGKRPPKYPCKECSKNVRNNQDALLCATCKIWSHAKCLGMTKASFKYYLDNANLDWTCSLCSLPFGTTLGTDSNQELDTSTHTLTTFLERNTEYENGVDANEDPPNSLESLTIVDERKANSSEALIVHLNVNSIQNKFEELRLLNEALKAHVLVISETKIGSSYPSNQFSLNGYHMYRNDRAKGGGGLIAYVSSSIPSRKLALPKTYKTLEAIAVETRIGMREILILGVYRPPKKSGNRTNNPNHKHLEQVEQEINELVMWASLQKQCIVLVGDLKMNRLKPNEREGKILIDMEEVNNFQCMISEPTRITPYSQTLLDVILTTTPDYLGNVEPLTQRSATTVWSTE